MESMGKKPARRSFTPEFKAEIVGLCQRGDRSVGQVAKDFDLTETAVREWVKQAERDAGYPRGWRPDQRRAAGPVDRGACRAAAGKPQAPRGRGDPQAGDGFLRVRRRPGERLPVHRGGESAAGATSARACELLKVSRAAFYAAPRPAPSPRDRQDAGLTELIQAVHDAVEGPVRRAADARGTAPPGRRHARKRIARLMRSAGAGRREAVEEDHHPRPGGRGPGGPRSAGTSPPTQPRTDRWCGDITYSAQLAVMCSPGWEVRARHGDCRSWCCT